jgi:hypothetical protein
LSFFILLYLQRNLEISSLKGILRFPVLAGMAQKPWQQGIMLPF